MNTSALQQWLKWHPISEWDCLPLIAGVYEIFDHVSGLSYIGSAVSLRKRHHYTTLAAGKSHNVRLQKDFSEHAEVSFSFRVLDFCPDENPVSLEQKRIEERDFNTLYNVAPIAGSTLGYRFTDEQVQEAKKIRRGVPIPYETRKKNWRKSVDREFKTKLYRKLLRQFRRTQEYELLCQQIDNYLASEPNFGKPVIVQFVPGGRKITMGKNFQTWWTFGGGRLGSQGPRGSALRTKIKDLPQKQCCLALGLTRCLPPILDLFACFFHTWSMKALFKAGFKKRASEPNSPNIARVTCNVRPEGFDAPRNTGACPFDKLRAPSLSRGSGLTFRRVEGLTLSKALLRCAETGGDRNAVPPAHIACAPQRSCNMRDSDFLARHEEYFQRRPWEKPPRKLEERELANIVDHIDEPYQFKKAMDVIATSATSKIDYYSSPESQ